ncbi:23S rRNA (adenine(2030)-N(6))-methyltransferase RlmJ [Puniceibacterium confluentis]|uniref:23S rRNA (adenine(2030)-N(6))-methyltransferase RlmJ n=1 Tax=Puniceibacterium confluentis TaxID=1958944 RepID=UPI003564D01C
MLSYQHHYHAGNLADVHKHALLAWMLTYLIQKDKPLSYIETHAGRGLYDLTAPEAVKTGEAAMGITRAQSWFAPDHPYRKAVDSLRTDLGASAYPGSPLIAAKLLRDQDTLHFAELHPGEVAALRDALWQYRGHTYQQDGFELAQSLCPPEPRRGLLLIDPSYEIKSDYDTIPKTLAQLHRKWNVGVLALWYPLLKSGAHLEMLGQLQRDHPDALRHEVTFPPIRDGHRMIGSGMFVINPPFGVETETEFLTRKFARLT